MTPLLQKRLTTINNIKSLQMVYLWSLFTKNNNEIQGVPKNKWPPFFKNMIINKTNALQILYYSL